MLDFEPVRCKQMTVNELAAPLSLADLRNLTNEMVDRMQALIADCKDEDVVFEPVDPAAGCRSRPNFANRSCNACRKRLASSSCWKPTTKSSA